MVEKIVVKMLDDYLLLMNEYIKETHELTNAELLAMIVNINIRVSASIFLSIKDYLPVKDMDLNKLIDEMLKALKDSYLDILFKKHLSKEEKLKLITSSNIKEVMAKGYSIIKLPDGTPYKITKQDLIT
jgi:alcohol dehydrogenase class IV